MSVETDGYDHNQNSTLLVGQTKLLDISTTPHPVGDHSLELPNNPLHFEAYKLQALLDRLDDISKVRPAQFSPQGYIAVLEKFTSICKQIKKESAADGYEESDPSGMEENGDYGATSSVGTRDAVGVGAGISSDNPFAR